jgi:hypothetical protein
MIFIKILREHKSFTILSEHAYYVFLCVKWYSEIP